MTKNTQLPVNTDSQRPLRTVVPTVDIFESDDAYLVRADVPGVNSDHVDLQFHKGQLRVEATRGATDDGVLDPVSFRRSFEIPEAVDNSQISATLRDGVLELRLPKTPEVTPRKIAITN